MNKLMTMLVAALVAGAVVIHAGCGECPSSKAAKQEEAAACPVAKLKLTDEQAAKVAELQKECAKATDKAECKKICDEGMAKILTPEQLKQWQADGNSCPVDSKAAKSGCGSKSSCGTKSSCGS